AVSALTHAMHGTPAIPASYGDLAVRPGPGFSQRRLTGPRLDDAGPPAGFGAGPVGSGRPTGSPRPGPGGSGDRARGPITAAIPSFAVAPGHLCCMIVMTS